MYRVESYESNASGVSVTSSEVQTMHEDRRAFEEAKTVEELQRLTIAFLKGERVATSYHFGPLLAESSGIVASLIRLNELGFLTTASQPGSYNSVTGLAQRCYVEGILPRRFLGLFLQAMYTLCGNRCFIHILDREWSYEEVELLEARDVYWLTKQNRTKLLHVSEVTGPCHMFQTCEEVYPQLADEYIGLCILDVGWGSNSSFIIEMAIRALETILAHPTQSAQKSKSQ